MRNKYLGIGFVVLSLALVGTGGFFVWDKAHAKSLNSFGAEAGVAAGSASSGTSSTDGLNVGSAGSDSTGQLSTGGQNLLGSGNSGSSGANASSSSSSSSPQLPDPSTFAQYDKYKDSSSVAFGDVQTGNGTALAAGQTASVYYRGYLTNGTLFDATRSDSSGTPQAFSFTEGQHQVIAGWEEGLLGMKVGGIRLLIVPPSLGYGAQAQSSIPANSVLVFEVQLLSAK